MEQHSNYPVEQLTRTRGKLILARMLHLRPGYLPGRHDLVQLCKSWIALHTNGKNKLKNVVLDLFTQWAAFPCVTELTTETVISPLKGAALDSAPFNLLQWQCRVLGLYSFNDLVTCCKENKIMLGQLKCFIVPQYCAWVLGLFIFCVQPFFFKTRWANKNFTLKGNREKPDSENWQNDGCEVCAGCHLLLPPAGACC